MRPGQIMSLIALVSDKCEDEFGGQKFALLYTAFPCKRALKKPSGLQLPFPLLQYDYVPRTGDLNIVCDFVDSITLPAMIQPTSMDPEDYFRMRNDIRKDVRFFSIPYKFLFRDGWDDVNSVQENIRYLDVDTSTLTYRGLMSRYLHADTGAKNAILKSMKSMATQCRTEAITEEDVLQAAVDNVAG